MYINSIVYLVIVIQENNVCSKGIIALSCIKYFKGNVFDHIVKVVG